MLDLIRWCEDIGMFATDRPINDVAIGGVTFVEGSCVHRTGHCEATCFNNKLYKLYPAMAQRDIRVEQEWRDVKGSVFASALLRKRKQTSRVRFKTRGETIKEYSDIARVKDICTMSPDTTFWMPTRAWRNTFLRLKVKQLGKECPNLVPLASTDPDTTDEEWGMLKGEGWSTMFYGDDNMTMTPNGDRMFKCPKTHKGLKGHCAICKGGCFAPDVLGKRADVHLSQH